MFEGTSKVLKFSPLMEHLFEQILVKFFVTLYKVQYRYWSVESQLSLCGDLL